MQVIDTTDAGYWRDPHRVLRAARAVGGVVRDGFGTPIVLGYDAIDSALRDPRLVNDYDILLTRHGIDDGPLFAWWKLAMLNTNPPVHTRLRALANRAFTPRAAEAWRDRMRAMTEAHLARLPHDRDIEFIDAVAEPLPLTIVCALIGIPAADHAVFHHWVADLGLMFSDTMSDEIRAVAERAMRQLNDYVVGLIEAVRTSGDDSLLATLVEAEEAGDRLSHAELVALVVNLLLGALDTSRSALTSGLLLMSRHGVRHASAAVIDEVLRYEPPSGELRRTAAVDLAIAGVEVAAGQSVGLSVMAANRDPAVYADPDVFDPDRFAATPALRAHLSFGKGGHLCLGQALARIEMQEVLGTLFARHPALEVVTEAPQWTPFLRVRRYDELRVRLGPPA